MARQVSGWFGFAALAVVIVGLVGTASTYLIPVPYERLAAREATLDEAAAAATRPDARTALDALAPRLDDSADVIGAAEPDDPAGTLTRIARARADARAALLAEAATIATRMRAMVLVTTVMAVLFVGAMLRAAAGPPPPRP